MVVQLVRIPACHAGGREFESRPPRHFDLLAQLVEQFPFKEWALGSNPRQVTTLTILCLRFSMTLSSSGQGYYVFNVKTEVQIL